MRELYGSFIVYNKATVYHNRNEHDLIVDMEDEMIGYRKTLDFLLNNYRNVMPQKALDSYNLYKSIFNK